MGSIVVGLRFRLLLGDAELQLRSQIPSKPAVCIVQYLCSSNLIYAGGGLNAFSVHTIPYHIIHTWGKRGCCTVLNCGTNDDRHMHHSSYSIYLPPQPWEISPGICFILFFFSFLFFLNHKVLYLHCPFFAFVEFCNVFSIYISLLPNQYRLL